MLTPFVSTAAGRARKPAGERRDGRGVPVVRPDRPASR
ncbi:hypothetical protein Tcur_2242 [Thermomonospora curvata DSM 43183]|uniref:Uncharacterized protein n=1 Tax=Thermomonospora curvata (strain ATCC 19995 / DSM 43183 / JCM 3096 / KCTC 9072 / NBRC 15933 / NCIMB 10081 / Henssen B9) TaxID=471852 RepID=D1A1X0_THECD|nr:hypothetical protein Tcur_2242 [Thermomonospora curvata DSM 43183]